MLQGSQVFSARLSSLWISLSLERYLLPFGQSMKARTLDCTDVNKYVGPTIVRLNKTEAFLAVEPLHNTRCHFRLQRSRNRLLPTQHVSKFDPAMSWGEKPYGAWPSRQPDNSNVATLSVFGKIDTRTISERRWAKKPKRRRSGPLKASQPSEQFKKVPPKPTRGDSPTALQSGGGRGSLVFRRRQGSADIWDTAKNDANAPSRTFQLVDITRRQQLLRAFAWSSNRSVRIEFVCQDWPEQNPALAIELHHLKLLIDPPIIRCG